MPDETAPEPSMDEILASIRRIISDDGSTGGAPASDDSPMLLTERVDPNPSKAIKPMTDDHKTDPSPSAKTNREGEWIGEAAAVRTSTAFDKLASMKSSPTTNDSIPLPAPGRSLEDIMRDMLRPMLKAWLDENLPQIVQDRVDEEVERLARRVR